MAEAKSNLPAGPRRPGFMRRLHHELGRRKVYRSAVAYVAIGAGTIELLAVVTPALNLPALTVTVAIIAVAAGFPFALVLSWLFRISADPQRSEASGARDESAPPPPRLPPETTPFVGREADLAELCSTLGSSRLVTVTGPGGVGKTRLALRAAERLSGVFPDGACLVPLAGVAAASLVPAAIAGALGLSLAAGEDPARRIGEYLQQKQLLLLADNFEEVASAAPVLAELLAAAPGLKILATSRERLGLPGERVLALEGLGVPAEHEPASEQADAVRLFVEAARRLDPDFAPSAAELETVARICRLVEGVPLAIELASAWVRMLPVAEIAREIEHDQDFLASQARAVPERHRSLRGVFESSWRLLPEEERGAFRRLSVFRGGFTRAAAEEVAAAPLTRLAVLLDKSLVRREGEERFDLLEVLRQYASEKLREAPAELRATRQRHGQHYLELLRRAAGGAGERGTAAIGEARADADNLRSAWSWAVEQADALAIGRGLEGLFLFYSATGLAREGADAFAAAAQALPAAGAGAVITRLRAREAVFRCHLGEYAEARTLLERCAEETRAQGDAAEHAFVLDQLGLSAFNRGDYAGARELHQQALESYRTLREAGRSGHVLTHLGNVAFALGDYGESERLFRESLAELHTAGDRAASFAALCNLGVIAGLRRDFPAADALFEQGLAVARETDNRRGIANLLLNLGVAAHERGEDARAEPFLREGVQISREMGFRRLLAYSLSGLANSALSLGDALAAEEHAREALATAAAIDDAPLLLEALTTCARVLAASAEGAPRALALLALVRADEAADSHTRETAGRLSAEIEARGAAGAPAAAPPLLGDAVRELLEERPALAASS